MPDFETQLHNRLDAIEQAARDDREIAHRKFDALLLGVRALLEKDPTMSKIADDLNSLASDIQSTASDNASKVSTLIGFKDENDTAFSGAVSTLTTARDAMHSTGNVLDQAIAAHNAGTTSGVAASATGDQSAAAADSAQAAQAGTATGVDPATGQPVAL